MGRQLLQQLIPAVARLKYSDAQAATPSGYKVFEQGRDKVDGFRGDPRTLGDALRIFQTANSLPYEYAGIAYTLLTASREPDGSYDQQGLDSALEWLERAQLLSPDVTHINAIEPYIYIFANRFDDARLVLDYLHDNDPEHYYLSRAEIDFWQRKGEPRQAIEWCEKAIHQAETVPQRLRVRSQMAALYAELGETEQALSSYQEAIHFAPNDGELWQKAATLYWQQENYKEAHRHNARALELQPDLKEAQQLRTALEEQQKGDSSPNLLGRLFG